MVEFTDSLRISWLSLLILWESVSLVCWFTGNQLVKSACWKGIWLYLLVHGELVNPADSQGIRRLSLLIHRECGVWRFVLDGGYGKYIFDGCVRQ